MISRPEPLSAGPYNQNMMPGDAPEWENGSFTAEPLQPELAEPQPLEPANDSAALPNDSLPVEANALQPVSGFDVSQEVIAPELPEAESTDLSFLRSLDDAESVRDDGPKFMTDEIAEPTSSAEAFAPIEFESSGTSDVESDAEFLEVAPLPPAESSDFLPPVPADE